MFFALRYTPSMVSADNNQPVFIGVCCGPLFYFVEQTAQLTVDRSQRVIVWFAKACAVANAVNLIQLNEGEVSRFFLEDIQRFQDDILITEATFNHIVPFQVFDQKGGIDRAPIDQA
ncbi:hypothetical protein D3C77_462810 [compost metagenome]